jgi:hypothetical protein
MDAAHWIGLEVSGADSAEIDGEALETLRAEQRDADYELSERLGREILEAA